MGQLGQAPDQPYNGAMIPQSSVPGRSVNFVQQSTLATATVPMAATGGVDVGTFEVKLQIVLNGKTVQWDNVIAWCYPMFYVDTESVGREWREGPLLTSGQTRIEMGEKNLLYLSGPTPAIFSHITYFSFRNFDSSSHSIIGYFKWKYIEIAA